MSLFHRGVDSNFYRPQEDARTWLRETFSIEEGPVLLFAGRISKDKNIDLLIEAQRRLLEYRHDLHLVIAGDGPYLADLRKQAKNTSGVCFAGRLDPEDLARAYSAADLFVFPSTTDTFGMVVLEAQSCGLPAIVSDVGGPKEIVLDGKTGFVAKAADADDWVDKIGTSIDLMERQQKTWASIGEQARRRVLERHDWNEVLRRIVALEASFTDGDRSRKTTSRTT
jgi:glycosyltransferase involved in cell wall biosynthesis